MRKLALIVALLLAVIVAPTAAAGIDVAITAPVAGAHSLSGVVPVMISASADQGIYSVQLEVDGVLYGIPDSSPVGSYQYEIDWDTGGVSPGDHTLTVLATDWSQIGGGARLGSNPITVDVGPAYPTVSLTAPLAYTFVKGTVQIAASATGGYGSTSVGYGVDLAPLPSSSWNTASVPDGAHMVSATATDARGKSATASVPVTVDNMPPSTSLLSPAANTFATGSLAVSASASDAYGVQSVRFKIDGISVGAPMTAPDGGSGYVYSQTLSLGGLANGPHVLTEVATDQAGNTATSAPVSFNVGVQPLVATLSSPLDWTFATKTVPVSIGIVGGAAPYSSQLYVDGKASGAPVTASPGSLSWDTSKVADGSHTISVAVTDSSHTTASTRNRASDRRQHARSCCHVPAGAGRPGERPDHDSGARVRRRRRPVGPLQDRRHPDRGPAHEAGHGAALPLQRELRHLGPGHRHAPGLGNRDRQCRQHHDGRSGGDHGGPAPVPARAELPRDRHSPVRHLRAHAGAGRSAARVPPRQRLPVGDARAVPAVARGRRHRCREAGPDHRGRRADRPAGLGTRCSRSTDSRRSCSS